LKILILDDEPLARDNLRNMLTNYLEISPGDIKCIESVLKAEEYVRTNDIDLLFIDIRMPYKNGFDFLKAIGTYSFEVIFVTAYEDFSLLAFKSNAIDYILKPIDLDDLSRAVNKVKQILLLKIGSKATLPKTVNEAALKAAQRSKILQIKYIDGTQDLPVNEIVYIKASGNYSQIFMQATVKPILATKQLGELEEELSNHFFLRVHKSVLFNTRYIKNIRSIHEGQVILANNLEFPVSRRKKQLLLDYKQDQKMI
jgi:two-component system, LytTR family, response regulator